MDHPQAASSRVWQKQCSWLGYNSVLVLVWLVLWKLASLMEYAPGVSIWYPPAALSLAAFIVLGARAWPAIIFVLCLTSWWVVTANDSDSTMSLIGISAFFYTLSHGGSYFLGALAARWIIAKRQYRAVHVTLAWLLLIAVLSALMSASIGTLTVWTKQYITSSEVLNVLLTWWFGDAVAVVILTPLFIALLGKRYSQVQQILDYLHFGSDGRALASYIVKLTLLIAVFACSLLLSNRLSHNGTEAYMGFAAMLILLPQLWLALTEPPLRTAMSLALLFLCVAIAVSLFDLRNIMLVMQIALLTIAAITWLVMLIPMLASDNRHLSHLANIDQLTGALLRHAFIAIANKYLDQRYTNQEPRELSLLMFDIDNFKQVNDQHGHASGDRALQLVATQVCNSVREDDVFGRFGGDEFLILLNGTKDDGLELSKRLQQQLQINAQAELDIKLSLSFGIIELKANDTIQSAIDHADALLYKAKRDGRGRAALAGTATTKALS